MTQKTYKASVEEAQQTDAFRAENLKLDFAINLERLRKAAGLTYVQIAKSVGSSPAYVSKVFRGESNLTIESMVKFSKSVGGELNIAVTRPRAPMNSEGRRTEKTPATGQVAEVAGH